METVFLILEILMFLGVYFAGVGVGLCSHLSSLLFLGLGLIAVSAFLGLLVRKQQVAQKDSNQSDGSE